MRSNVDRAFRWEKNLIYSKSLKTSQSNYNIDFSWHTHDTFAYAERIWYIGDRDAEMLQTYK